MKSGRSSTKLKAKASTPILKEKNGIGSAADTVQHLLKKRSVPKLRSKTSTSNMRERDTLSSLLEDQPSSMVPFSATHTSKKQIMASSAKQEDEMTPGSPRFMMFSQAQAIKPVEYQPKPQYTGPAIPRIMGCEPTITRKKPVEAKRESQRERVWKAIKKRHEIRKAGLRALMKSYKNIMMIRTMRLSMKAIRHKTSDRLLECKPKSKPVYRIKEIRHLRRASQLLSLPQNHQRPMSTAAIESIMSVDYRRYSGLSAYSDRGDDLEKLEIMSSEIPHRSEIEETLASLSVNEDENHTVRHSLLPFRAWIPLIYDNANPYCETSEEEAYTGVPATSPSAPQDSSTCFFSLSKLTSQTHPSPKSLDDISPRQSLSSSSQITITPLRVYNRSTMTLELGPEAQDPFVDSPTRENHNTSDKIQFVSSREPTEKAANNGRQALIPSENIKSEVREEEAKGTGTFRGTTKANPMLQLMIRGRGDHNTRIPRPPTKKFGLGETQAKGHTSPQRRSSIPIAIHNVSKDEPSTFEGDPGRNLAKGIRVVEKTADNPETVFQPEAKARQGKDIDQANQIILENLPISSAPSIASSSDAEWKAHVLERPTGFTGDGRCQSFYGPRLYIAPSAEEVIMGPEGQSGTSQKYSPKIVGSVSKTATESNAREKPTESPVKKSADLDILTRSPVAPRKSCRTQFSFENISKRDFSSRELSIPRKPVGSPSSSSILDSSPDKDSKVPVVPKIPDEHKFSPNKDKSLPSFESNEAVSTGITETSIRKVEATIHDSPNPLRAISMHATFSLPGQEGPSTAISFTPNELVRNVTYDEIMFKNAEGDHLEPRGTMSKISESKSNRMLDSFRSIFKHKGSIDRDRVRNHDGIEIATEGTVAKVLSGTANRSKKDDNKSDSARPGSKLRTKYSRLPDSVSWSKGPRSISAPIHVSPGAFPTPTSSLSIPIPSFRGHEEDQTPSFAKPTKSTRIRAVTNQKLQTPVVTDGRTHRTSAIAASTGSPRRSSRFPRNSAAVLNFKKADQMTITPQKQLEARKTSKEALEATVQNGQSLEDLGHVLSQKHEEINTFIGVLCQRLCFETEENQRTRYLRYLLSLQQSLNELKNARREVDEAEEILQKKKSQRTVAENSLFEKYRVAQNRIDTTE